MSTSSKQTCHVQNILKTLKTCGFPSDFPKLAPFFHGFFMEPSMVSCSHPWKPTSGSAESVESPLVRFHILALVWVVCYSEELCAAWRWMLFDVDPMDYSAKFPVVAPQLWPFISYNWSFLWDYKFYEWGSVSTYKWYNSDHNCRWYDILKYH